METIEEFVEVDGLYFLFLFLGIHLLKLYWAGKKKEGYLRGNRRREEEREREEEERAWVAGEE